MREQTPAFACSFHYDIKGKMGIGISDGKDFDITLSDEYIYLSRDGKLYEATQLLSEDSVYVSKASLDKIKKGKIPTDEESIKIRLYAIFRDGKKK